MLICLKFDLVGPLGGIICGLLLTAVTGKVLDKAEEQERDKSAEQKLQANPTSQKDEPASSTERVESVRRNSYCSISQQCLRFTGAATKDLVLRGLSSPCLRKNGVVFKQVLVLRRKNIPLERE